MSAKQKIIMGMGNAVLDVLIPCNEHEIRQMKLKKGSGMGICAKTS